MNDIAIKVEGLSKLYKIGSRQQSYKTLRNTLTDAMYIPFRRIRSTFQRSNVQRANNNYIWALKDVSFEIKPGEVVGIIGRNGTGKTTLLKILSRITEPTEGYAKIHGRVGSLLEVGTGFHPELTGRENIYLNSAILGMKRVEIERKFDEIVAFAEVEKFIDTPVKHYSSGMYVRLAFSVAAHLEPEILLVDEVLAVGDAAFQKKCLGKMGDVAKEGRTVLFVSHNLAAIQALCKRAIWLDGGLIQGDGPAQAVVGAYVTSSTTNFVCQPADLLPRLCGGTDVRLVGIDLLTGSGYPANSFEYGSELNFEFTIRVLNRDRRFFAVEWIIYTMTGERVLYGSSSPQHDILISPTDEYVRVECKIPFLPLASGSYRLDCLLSIPHQERLDEVEGAARFEIVRCDPWNTGFNQTNTLAPTTTANHWRILAGASELLAHSHENMRSC